MTTIPSHYKPTPDLLKNRVILITGASGAIGSCAARSFAAHGATVVLMGRKQRPLEKIYDDIVLAGGEHPAIIPFSFETAGLDDYDDIARLLEGEFGRLDGVLHTAHCANSPILAAKRSPLPCRRISCLAPKRFASVRLRPLSRNSS